MNHYQAIVEYLGKLRKDLTGEPPAIIHIEIDLNDSCKFRVFTVRVGYDVKPSALRSIKDQIMRELKTDRDNTFETTDREWFFKFSDGSRLYIRALKSE